EMRRADLGDPDLELGVLLHDRAGRARVVEVDVREQQVPDVRQLDAAVAQRLLQPRQRRRGAAVEEQRPVGAVEDVDADRALHAAKVEVNGKQRIHNPIFAMSRLASAALRITGAIAMLLLLLPGSALAAQRSPTRVREISYRAHDGRLRRAYLALPSRYDGRPIALVISPHGRGVGARENARCFGELPGLGGFAVVAPGGEGRRLGLYSWGDPGEIADLARMPAIAARYGVRVDPRRVFAVGGSMGGQEVLLLAARYPHLLAGVAAFDP